MPADLTVTVFCRSTLREVRTFQNGILSEFVFDREHRFLQCSFLFKDSVIVCLLRVKKAYLLKSFAVGDILFGYNAAHHQCQSSYKQRPVNYTIIKLHCTVNDLSRGRGMSVKIDRTVGVFGDSSPIIVCCDLPFILTVCKALTVIIDRKHDLICHKPFIHQVKGQHIRHFPKDKTCALIIAGLLQNLSRCDAVVLRSVFLNCLHSRWLNSPCVVYQQLCIFAQELIQLADTITVKGMTGNVAHSINAQLFKP